MIKNYTSSVPVERTIMRIESVLVQGGATNISKDYKEGTLKAIFFSIVMPDGKRVSIRLPANADKVYEVMQARIKKPRKLTMFKVVQQADRTAWKLVQDWVEVQMSLITMQKADFLQVFLPYVWDGNRTFYTSLKESNFKLLSQNNGTAEEPT